MSCDRVEKSAQKLLATSHCLQASVQDDNIRTELFHLWEFIEELLPKFSASGFFRINQHIIPAFLSAMTSYIIIIIQFEM
uniref:Putative gustatory receptor GR10 n=1 Tax=Colaphellus bowringi TaxID=561076 RepID=A0A0S3J3G6_9CUCU|nr:putative gustatory receptor GR10 [Colaphellus bowringi]